MSAEPPQLATILKGKRIEHFDVSLFGCEWGCIDLHVAPLVPDWKIGATHLNDPFPEMIEWLEAIIAGAPVARWSIAREGSSNQFVFLPARGMFHDTEAVLLFAHSSCDIWRLAGCTTTPRAIVESFYTAFRRFVESPDYVSDMWEWGGVREEDMPDDIGDEEYDRLMRWHGEKLRELRSAAIEAFLADDPDDPSLGELALRE